MSLTSVLNLTARVTLDDEVAAVRTLLHAASEDGKTPGSELAKLANVACFGPWSLGMLTSNNYSEALSFLNQVLSLLPSAVGVRVSAEEGTLQLTDDHLPADVRSVFLERDITVAISLLNGLLPGSAIDRVHTSLDDEACSRIESAAPFCTVLGNRNETLIVSRVTSLNHKLPHASPSIHQSCIEECLLAMKYMETPRLNLSESIREQLKREVGNMPSLEQMARLRNTTARTLRRRLTAESVSYRDLCADVRMAAAVEMLDQGHRVAEVSRMLGYSEPSAFTKAFKNWSGASPRQYFGD
ncbi:AraC family transcriptional regulator [Mycolicibacterium fortuitum]|nr:AraC family transcriptional regulator [Mycolicibacterium fortuitum]